MASGPTEWRECGAPPPALSLPSPGPDPKTL